jgi:hypothetical protein
MEAVELAVVFFAKGTNVIPHGLDVLLERLLLDP